MLPLLCMCDQDVASVCTQDSCQLSHGHYRLSLFLLAEAARVKDVQGGALARSCKKRKATTQEVEAADPSLQEAGAGVDAFSIQSRIAVGRGADVLLTKDILRSTGLGCGVDTFGHVVRHRSVGEVRHRPFLLAHMQGIGCRPAAGQHNSTLAPATHMRLSGCLVFCPQCPLSTLLCPQLPLPGQQLKILPDPASEAAKQQRFWYAMYLGEAPAQTFDGLAEKEDASRIKVPATTKQCHLPTQRRS